MTRDEALQELGLDGTATQAQIKDKYRRLCLRLHPDRFRDPAKKKEATSAFLKVRDAYEFFKNNGAPKAAEPRRSKPAADEAWQREMAAVLRKRAREQESGLSRVFWSVVDRLGLEIPLLALVVIVLVFPIVVTVGSSLTFAWEDAVFGVALLFICRRLAARIRGSSS